jgi:hypothetical protein
VKTDIGKTINKNYLLHNATSYDSTMGSSSGKDKKIGDIRKV